MVTPSTNLVRVKPTMLDDPMIDMDPAMASLLRVKLGMP